MKNIKKLLSVVALVLLVAVTLPTNVKADSQRVPNQRGVIGWGAKYSGSVTGDTIDVYKFSLPQSGNVNLIFDGTKISGYSWLDSYIALYDDSGEQLQKATIEESSRLINTTLLAGEYEIKVWSDGDSEHKYNFVASFEGSGESKTESYWDKNDTIITATPYSVGKRVIGNIAQNDSCDVYSFKVSKDGFLTLNLLNKINAIGYKLESQNGDVSLQENDIKVGTTKEKFFVTKGTYYLTFLKSRSNYGNYTFSTSLAGMPTIKLKSVKALKNSYYSYYQYRSIKVAWGNVKDLSGYEIQYARDSKFKKGKKTLETYNSLSTIDSLKKNSKYWVRIRGYRTDRNNHRHYTKWSNVKSVKTKK